MEDSSPPMLSLFGEALACQSAEEQAAFLDRACGANAELRAKLESLLQAHRESGDFLLGRPASQPLHATCATSEAERPGATVGPYKLLEQIGEGGMGAVYMADQQAPVRRRVALKIIKPGMDTRRVIARFEAERQALALMDHPNIARVLDAGETASGRPYFVMELVRGVPINEYCDQHSLSISERLKLFDLVCHAVQHAHQKGIIHRDIKPTNVLVTLHDGRPVPKVIDFGIAKATGQQLTEKTLFTEFHQLIGTPLYMSPEQAELSGLDIDTRSDIYSLGVLLYELLTGTTPLERGRLKEAAYDEVRRIIREEDPPKPSTRASSLEHSQPSLAALRSTEPRKLCHLLQGDLDWIVMKALEKDRTRRYATAAGLAADIQRHLSDQPVEACPPSAAYRFRKFARRNRVALVTASVVLVALAAGTLVSSWQAIRATQAEALADARLRTEATARAEEARQRQVADNERREAEKQREAAEANFQKARQAVDEYFTLVSESKLLDVPGLQSLRRDLLEAALRFYRESANQRSSDPNTLASLAVTYLRVAEIYHATDRNDDAVAAMEQAMEVIDRLRRQHPTATEAHGRLAGFWKGLRRIKGGTEMPTDSERALRTLQRLANTWEELSLEHPSIVEFQSDLAAIEVHIADLLKSGGQLAAARPFLVKAQEIGNKLVRDNPSVPEYKAGLAAVYHQLAMGLITTDRAAEADALLEKSIELREQLVSEFPKIPDYRRDLAISLVQRGSRRDQDRAAEAEADYRRALSFDLALAREFPAAMLYQESLVQHTVLLIDFITSSGRTADTAEIAGTTLAVIEQYMTSIVGTLDPHVIVPAGEIPRSLGFGLMTQHQPVSAERMFLSGLKIFEHARIDPRAAQDETWRSRYLFFAADTHRALGYAIAQQGRDQEAEGHFRQAAELSLGLPATFFASNPTYSPYVAVCSIDYANFLRFRSRLDEAVTMLRQAVDYFAHRSTQLPENTELRKGEAESRFLLGETLQQSADPDTAQAEWGKAIELYHTLAEQEPTQPFHRARLSDSHWKIAKTLQSKGQIDPAIEAGQRAVEENERLVQAFPAHTDHRLNLAYLHRELSDMLRAAGRSAEAAEAFSASCELYKKLDADFPDKTEFRNDLTRHYVLLAEGLLAQAKHAETEGILRQAVQTFDELAAAHPAAPDYRRIRALFEARLARLRSLTGKADDADQAIHQAVDSHQKIIEDFPEYNELGLVYLNLAILLMAAGQPEPAESAYAKGVELVGNNADVLNNFAWRFATAPEPRFRQPRWGVELARKATEVAPQVKTYFNTLGVAQYRAGAWQDAVATLDQVVNETNGGTSFDFFFLAMAEWQLGNKESAQTWFAKAVEWMEKHQPENYELCRFQAEAQELLGIKPLSTSPPDAPAPASVATPMGS